MSKEMLSLPHLHIVKSQNLESEKAQTANGSNLEFCMVNSQGHVDPL